LTRSISASTPSGTELADGRGDVAVAREDVADAELAQEALVLGQGRRENAGPCPGGELDGEAADAAGGARHQEHVAVGERERVDERQGSDAGRRRGAGDGQLSRNDGAQREREDRAAATRPRSSGARASLSWPKSRCWAFLDFQLDRHDGALVLDIAGPADARPVIKMFFASEAA
jgi:hypothetical protein